MFSKLHLCLLLVVITGCASASPKEAEEWGTVFQHSSSGFGWSGGDAASSISLPGGRILWLFGDSYLSNVEGGQRTNVELRFGNTIAVENTVTPGVPPTPSEMTFDWGAANSNGWLPLAPELLLDPATPRSGKLASGEKLAVFSWPLHGVVVGADLVLFNALVTPFACNHCGPFSFKIHGSVASVVKSVDRPYAEWGFQPAQGWQKGREPLQKVVPWSRAADALDDPRGTVWGTFIMKDVTDPRTLYIYGNRRTQGASELVVARVLRAASAADLLDFNRWSFWTGSAWTPDVDSASAIASDAAVEGTLVSVPAARGGGFALVESGDVFGGEIRVSLAPAPWGPFALRYTLFLSDCPVKGFEPGAPQFTYAAKAHPELGTDEEMLVSLITERTSQTPVAFIADPHQYAPRFVYLPWDEVFSFDRSSKARCGTP